MRAGHASGGILRRCIDPHVEVACAAWPCSASAYAPTTRNRTSASTNARNRSTKSWFIGELAAEAPQFLAETPGLQDALGRGHLLPELAVVSIGFGGRSKTANRHSDAAIGDPV